jgi:mono/diheme cytochrome c family protein
MHEAVISESAKVPVLYGLVAEYDSEQSLLTASEQIRDAGFTRWDTHAPYPVHGLDKAMGVGQSPLPFLVFGAGLTGMAVALGLQYLTNAFDYPYMISGKPMFSIPACIPVLFELTVLFSALTAFGGMLMLNGLPKLYHPLFSLARFSRATSDRFFIAIEAVDPKFDSRNTRTLLNQTKPRVVEECFDAGNNKIPFAFFAIGIMTAALALIPPAVIYKMRNTRSATPKFHAILDMDFQNKYKAQSKSTFFKDGKTSRPQVAGTVAQGQNYDENEHLYTGKVDGKWMNSFPFTPDEKHMQRGQERFGIYCAVCHGNSGNGDGMVARRVAQMMADKKETEWIAPANLNYPLSVKQTAGELFNTVTHGKGNMAAYGPQISAEDRWNIVLYVRALQRSSNALDKDLPAATQKK